MIDMILTVFAAPLLVAILTALFEYWLNSRNK
ncbi:MAG: type I toxin-antitoxin system Fst family toxin [Streptococcus sp.]|nr:type I toxin-antitoxin system Fst family toxin [Streptococcus sp.]